MKTASLTRPFAQGDVLFVPVDIVPADATPVPKWDRIVAESETHHHHMFRATDGVQFFRTQDPFVCFLRLESDALLEHHRDFHTHESIMFPAGSTFQVRRQREHTPEGYRMVAD
jgi:hypothetical protein